MRKKIKMEKRNMVDEREKVDRLNGPQLSTF